MTAESFPPGINHDGTFSIGGYRYINNLGMGGHSVVDQVRDPDTGKCYARKMFKVNRRRSLREVEIMLRQEVANIRVLEPHPHIIRVHQFVVEGKSAVIFLEPVANSGTLADYLDHLQSLPRLHEERRAGSVCLKRAFGCLASALEWMHMANFRDKPIIRHKDIKPSNILIHDGRAIFTDFGVSKSYTEDHTTTEGRPDFLSKRYCAPEAADHGRRNRSSDVFSLGCVFVEMLAIIFPVPFRKSRLFDNSSPPYYEQYEALQLLLVDLKDLELAWLLYRMLEECPESRPSAAAVNREMVELGYGGCDDCQSMDFSICPHIMITNKVAAFNVQLCAFYNVQLIPTRPPAALCLPCRN
jgi:serine/threonine protein kinase